MIEELSDIEGGRGSSIAEWPLLSLVGDIGGMRYLHG
jgi:hypothetical protein